MHIGKKMMIQRFFLILFTGCILVGSITGCQPAFQYPKTDAFTLEAAVKNTNISVNDPIEIDCKLLNQSKRNYNISHSSEAITWQFEEQEEKIHAIEIEKQFQKRDFISRQITLDPLPAGSYEIIIQAAFHVKSEKNASEFKEYTYSKTLKFEVADDQA